MLTGGRLLTRLDALLSHNAVVAVLSAGLALGATWWLDSRAARREEQAQMHALVDALIADMNAHRFAVEQAVTAAHLQDHPDPQAKRAAVRAAREDILDASAPANSRMQGQVQRLARYFSEQGQDDPNPMEIVADGPVANVIMMIRCATSVLDAVEDGISLPSGERRSDLVFTTCDGSDPMPQTPDVSERLAALDDVGFAQRVLRHMICTARTQRILHRAIDEPDTASRAFETAMSACGTEATATGIRFLPITLEQTDLLP